MKTPASQQGFTLIELMATMAIIAITLVAGAPAFRSLTQNNYMTSKINEFVADLNLTRSEAVKRATPVTLCKRNTAGNGCNSSGNWTDGWLIFVDTNNPGVVDAGEEILRVHDALTGLTFLNFSRPRITYVADGFLFPGLNGTLTFCDSRGISKAKGRVLSNTGRLRESVSGDTLKCE